MTLSEITPYLVGYLLAVNIVTGGLAVVDRMLAPLEGRRIPEKLLLGLSLAGGAAAAKLVQITTWHKAMKYDYTAALTVIAIFQLAIAGGVWTIANTWEERRTIVDFLSPEGEEDEPIRPRRIELQGQDDGYKVFGG